MCQDKWQKITLVCISIGIGILLFGAQVSGQDNDNIPIISAPLPTFEPPTLLQAQLERPDSVTSNVPFAPLAASAAVSRTRVITALADTLITQGYPTANCGDELEMRVGYDTYLNPDGETLHSLIRFNLASISTDATVHSATLWLFLSGSYDYPGHSVPITPYRISSPWAVDTVTWASQPSYTESYTPTWVVHGFGVWYPFDVIDLVRHWAAGTYPNYGLVLLNPGASNEWRAFATSETIYPPHLIVSYEQSPNFTLTMAPDTQTVVSGQNTSSSSILYVTSTDGFSESTTLDIAGLPPDTSHTWSASPVTPTASTLLTITTTPPSTPRGVYTLTITGTSASLVQTTTATLQVLQPDFEMDLQPTLQSVGSGQDAYYTAHLVALGGFTGSVMLDVDGVPPNASSEWSLNPIEPTASTVLTIVTTQDTPTGTHSLTITGTSGEIVHSASVSLTVRSETVVYLPLVLRNYPTGGNAAYHPWRAVGPPQTATDVTQDTPVSRIALVIGVADYEHMEPITSTRQEDKTHDLGSPDNDAFDLEGELSRYCDCGQVYAPLATSHCGDTSMTMLVDRHATKGAIHAAIINWMDPLEDENTLVMISFSGHGMYAPDDDGDENDPYDEFIVPHDIDMDEEGHWLPETAISDDELASWLGELESQQIVVFIDSCFAGGMITDTASIKGFSWKPAAQSDIRAAEWRDSFLQDIQGAGRVVLAATTEEQASWEFGELQNGVFTYYLVEALHSTSADTNSNGWISAEEAYNYLDGRVDDYVWNHTSPPEHQNPQISDDVSGEVDITQPVSCDSCPVW